MRDAGSKTATSSVVLVEIAGQRINLLASATIPLYVVGVFATRGVARVTLIVIGLFLAVAILTRKTHHARAKEAPATLILGALIIGLWSWLMPDEPQMAAAVMAATMVFTSLMSPRPFAEIGLGVAPVSYAVTQIAFRGPQVIGPVLGVAATYLALGTLLLFIRVKTERRVAESTAALAAANERLEQLNRTDPLTGLANRRHLDEALTAAWSQAGRSGAPVGAVMIDVDHFKLYNDHYGHLGGDECLRKVAGAVTRGIRGTDTAARYGGEEFLILLPGADLEVVRQVAERIRREIAGLRQEHAPSPIGVVSVSLGVAAVRPAGGSTADDLIQLADQSLYQAKHYGRNRIGGPAGEPRVSPVTRAGAAELGLRQL